MAFWRVSMVFRNAVGVDATSGSQYGWSENLYSDRDMTPTVVAESADALVAARLPLLTRGWRISNVRFAALPSTRTAFSVSYTPEGGRGTYGEIGSSLDEQAYDKLILSTVCESGRGGTYTLGGIGHDVVDAGGVYLAPGRFTAAFPAFERALRTNWAKKRNIRNAVISIIGAVTSGNVPSTATPQRPVVSLRPAGIIDGGFVRGSRVRITAVQGMAFLNGTWNVETIGAGDYLTLAQKRGVSVVGSYIGGGSMWSSAQSFDGFLSASPRRGSSRRTGGTGDRPRGRRSTRRS